MDVTYLGHSSFKLKGKDATVVTDPYAAYVGMKMPSVSADVITISHHHDDHDGGLGSVTGTTQKPQPFVIDAPGEYEVQGVSIFGYPSFHDTVEGKERGKNTIFVIHMEDVVIAHCGDVGHPLTEKQLEQLGDIDVLLLPVGGTFTIDPGQAVTLIDQIEPAFVIPMHYKTSTSSKDFADLKTVEDFLREAGAEGARREKKLSVAKLSLPEDREIVVLEPA